MNPTTRNKGGLSRVEATRDIEARQKVAHYREGAAIYIFPGTPINEDTSLLHTIALICDNWNYVVASLTTKLEAMEQKRHSGLLAFNSSASHMEISLH